jgi:hypothetical protein
VSFVNEAPDVEFLMLRLSLHIQVLTQDNVVDTNGNKNRRTSFYIGNFIMYIHEPTLEFMLLCNLIPFISVTVQGDRL